MYTYHDAMELQAPGVFRDILHRVITVRLRLPDPLTYTIPMG